MAALLMACQSFSFAASPDSSPTALQPIFVVWFNAESILLLLKQDPEVAHLAAVYLRWVSIGLPGMILTFSDRAIF